MLNEQQQSQMISTSTQTVQQHRLRAAIVPGVQQHKIAELSNGSSSPSTPQKSKCVGTMCRHGGLRMAGVGAICCRLRKRLPAAQTEICAFENLESCVDQEQGDASSIDYFTSSILARKRGEARQPRSLCLGGVMVAPPADRIHPTVVLRGTEGSPKN